MRRPALLVVVCLLAASPAAAQYRFDHFTTSNGLPQNTISSIAQTPDGYLWFGTFDGLVRYDGVRFTIFDVGNTPAIRSNQMQGVRVDADGTLWANTGAGRFIQYKDGAFSTATERPQRPAADAADRANPRWRQILGQFVDAGAAAQETHTRVAGEDRDGGVWIVDDRKIARYADGRFLTYDGNGTFSSNFIRALFIDREGTIWVGTNDNGLFRLTRQFLTTLGEADGLAGRIVYPVYEDRAGTMWIGSGQVSTRYAGGRFTPFPTPRQARAFFEDRSGRLWIGTNSGLFVYEHGALTERSALVPGTIDAILQSRDGALWFASTRSIVRLLDDERTVFTAADGVPESAPGVGVLLQDRQGRMWAGSGSGLARLDGSRWTVMTKKDGLAGDRVRSLYEDADGVLWVGTFDSGITRIENGRITNYTTQTGLFNNGAFQILEDPRGNLWISSNRGIYRVSRREMNEFAAGKRSVVSSVAYGTQDGMLSAECNGGRQPAGVKAKDGRLWFPTQNGVVVIDPSAVTYNTQAPLLSIESVVVDRSAVDFRHGVRLEPGQSDLEITYSAPSSMKAEHIQFKYRLDGLSDQWVDVGSRRSVHYSHLPAGGYTFTLRAGNSDGVWNEQGTSLNVYVKPYFYQTGWFLALCLVGVAATGSGGYAWRIHQLKANEKRLTMLVDQRTSELHERSEQLKVANAMLEELATVDGLTGVANRRRFNTFLTREWQRAARNQAPLSLLMMDVDHFKAFNDTYGHQQGDECLRQVGGVLVGAVQRLSDLAARYGGEEFAVILTDTDMAGARVVAESIRGKVAALGIPHRGSKAAEHVTVSVGVASMVPNQYTAPNDLVAACDHALYQAKEQGRNRVVAAT